MFPVFICRSFDDELKTNELGITDKDIALRRDQNFAKWLKNKVSYLIYLI